MASAHLYCRIIQKSGAIVVLSILRKRYRRCIVVISSFQLSKQTKFKPRLIQRPSFCFYLHSIGEKFGLSTSAIDLSASCSFSLSNQSRWKLAASPEEIIPANTKPDYGEFQQPKRKMTSQ